mmetsp:Transcript_7727/g.13753  ORF Transcript_7727/g.13753 Transcript_7727/m.13753 type:complete len:467 (-) Transcript_7727:1746-3146(-)
MTREDLDQSGNSAATGTPSGKENPECADPSGTNASLHYPHPKAYCVEFQSKYGTLKGIENEWAAVPPNGSCEWENQQHGRGHHLKVVIRNPKVNTTLAMRLVYEDGTPAPAFTRNKSGQKKSTMLVGIDSREWRLGFSWANVRREGPRKWHAAATCRIVVVEPDATPFCEIRMNEELVVTVPAGVDIIVPIRIEVLSAVKGASNFSRYAVHCFETNMTNPSAPASPLAGGWSWVSPNVLVEAKWLPAAPVRIHNKQRFGTFRNGMTRSSSSGTLSHSHDAEVDDPVYGPNGSVNSNGGKKSSTGSATTPPSLRVPGRTGGPCGYEDFLQAVTVVQSFLAQDPMSRDISTNGQVDMTVQDLQCAVSKYLLQRRICMQQTPSAHAHPHHVQFPQTGFGVNPVYFGGAGAASAYGQLFNSMQQQQQQQQQQQPCSSPRGRCSSPCSRHERSRSIHSFIHSFHHNNLTLP